MTPLAMHGAHFWRGLGAVCLLAFAGWPSRAADLTHAVLLTSPGAEVPQEKAAQMLLDEVNKRSGVRWERVREWPGAKRPVVVLGQGADFQSLLKESPSDGKAAEGYRIRVAQDGATVFALGNDERGVLFAAGRLLRELEMEPGRVAIQDGFTVASAPKYSLRGHQLGYRPKCNSYDAWDLAVWEQYYRDLVVFGCNAIELIPPRSDDDADSPHFPRPPMEMMKGMSGLAKEYGLDVWVWYPAMDPDYTDARVVDAAVAEWAAVFRELPRIDAVFVPGGDPGHTQPRVLMKLLERQAHSLATYHPKAKIWVSPQGFNQAWMEEFIDILKRERPSWLGGVVHGPQVRVSIGQLRELVPAEYPIRQYPDITHTRQCQYPVPDWDTAFAVTEGRECINPRPEGEAIIFRRTQPETIGFITYSEGCNDDVNKCVWSALGWDPEMEVAGILREYARYFMGFRQADAFAQGLLALERNWRGPLLANAGVETTLLQFQALERSASPAMLRDWRFQQALLRAYYDACTRRRLLGETRQEQRATEQLLRAPDVGAEVAMDAALNLMDTRMATDEGLRLRIYQLAEALFQSIGMQLSVERYRAIAVDRGAMLDTLDFPLNNRLWLREQIARIRSLGSERERVRQLTAIVNWANPGPGGFYDDLGNISQQPRLVQPVQFEEDPARWTSPRVGFEEDLVLDDPSDGAGGARRISWMDHAEALYDAPLTMRYTGLDPTAHYRLRVLYGGDNPKRKITLVANGSFEVHPLRLRPVPFAPLEFELPQSLTRSGHLELTWRGEPGLGGNGRGCQVSEVWLLKK